MNQVSMIPSHDACFACGRLNDVGLGLVLETVGDRICCRTTLDSKYQGYDGIVHGGIVASIADAAMVHLVYRQHGDRPLTCSLNVRYRASVRVGDEVVASATILRSRHGIVWASCTIAVGCRLCAKASGTFAVQRRDGVVLNQQQCQAMSGT